MATQNRVAAAKPYLGVLGAGIMVALLVWLAFVLHNRPAYSDFALTVIVSLTGVTVGWLLGFLASPYTELEDGKFAKYAATLSAFLSGYVLSKVEPWISALVEAGRSGNNRVTVARTLIFTASMIVGAISMYVFRLYLARRAQETK